MTNWLEANPCHMVKQPGQEKQRDRVLSEDELRGLWRALDSEDAIIAAVFRLRLLTAQRGGEVLGATWDEMDLTSGWWTFLLLGARTAWRTACHSPPRRSRC